MIVLMNIYSRAVNLIKKLTYYEKYVLKKNLR